MSLLQTARDLREHGWCSLGRTKYANESQYVARDLEDSIAIFQHAPTEDLLRAIVALNARARYLLALDSMSAA